MTTTPSSTLSRTANAGAGLAAVLMASVLLKSPHTFTAYLAITAPFVLLLAIWNGYRTLSRAFDSLNVGELKAENDLIPTTLRNRAFMVALFGFFGIVTALTAGFTLGQMSIR
jgi:hypothetical protein